MCSNDKSLIWFPLLCIMFIIFLQGVYLTRVLMSLFGRPAVTPRSVFGGASTSTPHGQSPFGGAGYTAPTDAQNGGRTMRPATKSLFGGAKQQIARTTSMFGINPTPPAQIDPKSVFGQPARSQNSFQPQTSLFAPPGNTTAGSVFGQTNSAQNTSARSLFSGAKSEQGNNHTSSNMEVSAKSLFSQAQQPPNTDPRSVFGRVEQPSNMSTKSLFGKLQPSSNNAQSVFSQAAAARSSLNQPGFDKSSDSSRMFSSVQQPANALSSGTRSLFGKPAGNFIKKKTEEDDEKFYSLLEDLSINDRAAFEADEFVYGCIPLTLPPREMCHG